MADVEQWFVNQIVSGGQTGVDRAALDWARQREVVHGGWCPKGRLAADGPLPAHYLLRETDSTGYRQRTKLNVRDSDATLLFNMGPLDGGTLQTVRFAQTLRKPHLVVQLDELALEGVVQNVRAWLAEGRFHTVNVAGPREEKRPGVYACVLGLLDACLKTRDGVGATAEKWH